MLPGHEITFFFRQLQRISTIIYIYLLPTQIRILTSNKT